ncbi:muts domain V-domain-containing protein [Emericellopsis atlantica]|uniref:DNA mismatch repair protein MSH5 n=1 Tax=Emericellopsis atlantica TaxID=2614577 RepID=A0A9P7ZK14_9HYPO|nr:muts domain V-domain-containing protein [Emericellopsis atlantica]KAG9253534.1 muts domain V-domain-containing protein [Emericellopsis atlantica]
MNEVIMAIELRNKDTMGCAYFDTAHGDLMIAEDIIMADLEVAEQFLLQAEPTTVIVSGRAALASADFDYQTARDKLMHLVLDSAEPSHALFTTMDDGSLASAELDLHHDGCSTREASHVRALRCGGLINLDNEVSVSCAGAVLSDLHQRRSVGFLPDGQRAEMVFHVRTLRQFSLAGHMMVGIDTLRSLQIIRPELHPNGQTWNSNGNGTETRQSLSIYGLFHSLACTPQGRSALRSMLIRPSVDKELIAERQQTIEFFLQPELATDIKDIGSVLSKIKNASSLIAHLRRGAESPSATQSSDRSVWAGLQTFALHALRLRDLVGRLPHGRRIQIVQKILGEIHPESLSVIGSLINKTIDFEQSKSRQRPSVRVGIDPELDELKRRYDGMGSFLTEVINHITQSLPAWPRQYIRSCIFLPQLGFLTVVEPDNQTGKGRYEGEAAGDDQWERVFTADGAVCYKNNYMRELDEQFGDIYCEIGDREVEIIHSLAQQVLRHESSLIKASVVCGAFDALLSLARGAEKYSWTCPRLTEATELHIVGGRHPLQELVVPCFVPNDCHMDADQTAACKGKGQAGLALTGPNHSGKSVYLKQTAIIVYLAHVGSFVPAERATIGITDKILARISTRESVSRNESAFAIDLRQMAFAMASSTPKSLILIDEFGKGTNSDDGAGLMAAAVNFFLDRDKPSPRLLLATHFHELFETGLLSNHPGLDVAHMEILSDEQSRKTDDQITYLFKLAPGHSNSSYGSHCALMNGVPSAVVNRAEAIARLVALDEDLSFACAQLCESEEEQLQCAESVARRFLELDFEDQDPGKLNEALTLVLG